MQVNATATEQLVPSGIVDSTWNPAGRAQSSASERWEKLFWNEKNCTENEI